MRRLLAVVTVAVMVLAVVAFARVVTGIEREAKTYVDEVVPRIATSWASGQFLDHASPELRRLVPPEKVERLFVAFSDRLGPMTEYRGAISQHVLSGLAGGERVIRVRYLADVVFEKSGARIQIEVIKRGGAWRIHGFLVNADGLLP